MKRLTRAHMGIYLGALPLPTVDELVRRYRISRANARRWVKILAEARARFRHPYYCRNRTF
jgi:hypothetical protein